MNEFDKLKKDWLSFLGNDEFQMFIFVSLISGLATAFGLMEVAFFERVFLISLGLAFGDNTISSLIKR